MPLKISHRNKRNTSFSIQTLNADNESVSNFLIKFGSYLFIENENATVSMRLAERKELIKIEEIEELPSNRQYNTIYSPYDVDNSVVNVEKDAKTKVKEYASIKNEETQKNNTDNDDDVDDDDGVEEEKEYKIGKWEDSELTYLKKHYPRKGLKYVAEKLNRKEKSVAGKIEYLGLKKLKNDSKK